MQDDLTDLQMKMMELLKTVEDLNETALLQDTEIKKLKNRLAQIEGLLSGLDPALLGAIQIGDQPPPHY
ncbi:MAG: SlyX family protein [Pseudomonadota bacterium]